ncbi:MAG: response regulator [Candidatus Binatia bacterium]
MKKNVLLVEDALDMIFLVHNELQFLGYNCIVAEDGKKAVDMAASYLPDLILMDIVLPKMDGLRAVSLIRENPKTQSIPILAITALALPGDKEKCLQAGCDDYIAKPFTYLELSAAIKKLLNES